MNTHLSKSNKPAAATVSMPRSGRQPSVQRKCACGGTPGPTGECAECRRKRLLGQGVSPRQAKRSENGAVHLLPQPGTAGRGATRPLDPPVAQQFRPHLGPLIDRVRIHTGSHDNQWVQQQRAVAVTSGADIYFARGAYQPRSMAGHQLIAHELAHVHQQHRPDGPPPGYRSRSGDAFEQEADRFAHTGRLPAAASPVMPSSVSVQQQRTAAEQIATILRNAVQGLGTDEEAIFNALTGRTPAEIADIEAAYQALSGGETLEARLRDELSGDDLSRALSLLRGETAATETARRLWDAMRGLGTDEAAIYAAVAGRTAAQWAEIQQAYREMTRRSLLDDLHGELTDSEWQHLQTLLPGAPGGAATAEDRATVIANRLEAAMEGLGTDEDAIYAALTGRSDTELREIERRFRLLTGTELDVRLRDELNDREYARVQQLLHPAANPTRIAMRLREAVQGPGTDEREILAILTGRSADELRQIRAEYQRLYGEVLQDRLREELRGGDLIAALRLEQAGLLEPEDEIKLAVQGLGTDEERLFAVLEELNAAPNPRVRVQTIIDRYAAKGYGDMLADIRGDLSGRDLRRALELLHGWIPTGTCSTDERATGLQAISGAISLAQNAVGRLRTDIAAGRLSGRVQGALESTFNPGNAAGAVTLAVAGQVRTVLDDTRTDLLTRSQVTCSTPVPLPCGTTDICAPRPDCSSFTYAWTCNPAGSIVRLCPAFFSCLRDKPLGLLHEFVHHIGIADKFYRHQGGFSQLTPIGDRSANDSLDNADSFAHFAREVR